MKNKTVEEILREASRSSVEFRLVPIETPNGYVDFYIHPVDVDGETLDFTVDRNQILRLIDIAAGSARAYRF